MRQTQVVIVGAGIAGLVTASLLKEKGIQVLIYEQRAGIIPEGGGLSIWPNGSQVLLGLPYAADIKQLAGPLRFEYWGDANGNTLTSIDRNLLCKVNTFPFMNICRNDLHELLLKNVDEKSVVFNAKCQAIERNQDHVIAHFSNDDRVKADLIIGADGVFSTIRKLIFPESKIKYAGYVALVGVYKLQRNERKPGHHVIWGKNKLLLTFPVDKDRYMLYIVRPLPQGQLKHKCAREQQIKLFCGWSDEVDLILKLFTKSLKDPECANHFYCNENYELAQPLPSFHQGRVVLIGDAAYPMGSIMGFATNNALEEAARLSSILYTTKNLENDFLEYSLIQSRIKRFVEIENQKKEFLLNANTRSYAEFVHNVRNSSFDEFFRPILQALMPSIDRKIELKLQSKTEFQNNKESLWQHYRHDNKVIGDVEAQVTILRSRL